MNIFTPDIVQNLKTEKNIWLATTRPSGRPHLVPVWFVWIDNLFFMCINFNSVKSKNIAANKHVAIALEDGTNPSIFEGTAATMPEPWPEDVLQAFKDKYDWNIVEDQEYDQLLEITPTKWLHW